MRQPWIGGSYAEGFGGRRVLVLGESHYDWPERTFPLESLTVDCVRSHIAGGDRWTPGFWVRIEELLTGSAATVDSRERFWGQIAFHNYVVDVLTDGNTRPTSDQWSASRAPFLDLVKALRPHFILVLGVGTWRNMPAEPRKGPTISGARRTETGFYDWDGGEALAYAIEHPMYRFFGKTVDWHPWVNSALELSPRL